MTVINKTTCFPLAEYEKDQSVRSVHVTSDIGLRDGR